MRESSISDSKRAVRELQWEHARKGLRVRDKVHHSNWRIMTIAGPAPHEEINCIRELMHHAHITSVDIDQDNLAAAIEAGADEIIQCDVGALRRTQRQSRYGAGVYLEVPRQLKNLAFDVICLDLTGPADDWLKELLPVYFRSSDSALTKSPGILNSGGVLMVTFSYGRDVVEVYQDEWDRIQSLEGTYQKIKCLDRLESIPVPIASRLWYLFRGALIENLDSCLQYRGAMMPMVSCLLRKGPKPPVVRYEQLQPIDYDLLVTAVDVGKVFACPADRLQELRTRYARTEAARKAVETRRLRDGRQPQLQLVERSLSRLQQIDKLWNECTEDERAEVWKILYKLYTERKTIRLADADVRARSALLEDIRKDRDLQSPGT